LYNEKNSDLFINPASLSYRLSFDRFMHCGWHEHR